MSKPKWCDSPWAVALRNMYHETTTFRHSVLSSVSIRDCAMPREIVYVPTNSSIAIPCRQKSVTPRCSATFGQQYFPSVSVMCHSLYCTRLIDRLSFVSLQTRTMFWNCEGNHVKRTGFTFRVKYSTQRFSRRIPTNYGNQICLHQWELQSLAKNGQTAIVCT